MKNTTQCSILNTLYAILIALLCIVLPQTAQAAEYYLDAVNGDDANSGTSEAPWQTLARAYTWYSGEGAKVQGGDTVLFRNANYGEFKESAATESAIRYRSDWITYKADEGHTPTLSNIYISNQDKWGEIEHGKSYLIFDGFKILNGVSLQYTSYVQIHNCNITRQPLPYEGFYAPYYAGGAEGVSGRVTYHVTVEDCEISYVARGIRAGIYGGDYWTIKNNKIHRFAEDGIRPEGVNHLLIEGNLIYDTHKGRTGFGLSGTISGTFEVGETIIQAGSNAEGVISAVSSSTKLSVYTTSEALFTTAGGTVTGQSSGAIMSAISKCDYSHSDPIQIESGATVTDIVIRGNTFIPSASGCAYLRFYGRGTDVIIENNLTWNTGANPFAVGGVASGLVIRNNTFGSGLKLEVGYSSDGSKLPSVIDELYNNIMLSYSQSADVNESLYLRVASHGNNIFGSNPDGHGGPKYQFALNSTEAVSSNLNALFTNAAGNDYTLAAGSAAINFGNADYGPATDILGNLRDAQPDAGCYEYGTTSIIYGDASGDSEISAYDAALTGQAAVDLITLTPEQFSAADVDGSKDISAYDAALIAQYSVGLISKFPVEP